METNAPEKAGPLYIFIKKSRMAEVFVAHGNMIDKKFVMRPTSFFVSESWFRMGFKDWFGDGPLHESQKKSANISNKYRNNGPITV